MTLTEAVDIVRMISAMTMRDAVGIVRQLAPYQTRRLLEDRESDPMLQACCRWRLHQHELWTELVRETGMLELSVDRKSGTLPGRVRYPMLNRVLDILNEGGFHDSATLAQRIGVRSSYVTTCIARLRSSGVQIETRLSPGIAYQLVEKQRKVADAA